MQEDQCQAEKQVTLEKNLNLYIKQTNVIVWL